HYSSYDSETEVAPSELPKVLILGSGPNRIGQGIEFDYSCVHAVMALRGAGYETVMVNCNPETVSTDYDTADRLHFEPLTFEDVLEVFHAEDSSGKAAGGPGGVGGSGRLRGPTPLRRLGVRAAPDHARRGAPDRDPAVHVGDRARGGRPRAAQRPVRAQGRRAVRPGGEPAGVPHGAVRVQGHGRTAGEGGGPDHA